MGWDTGRYWEILGSGAGLLSPPPKIQIPNPLVAGEHYLSFDDFESLSSALEGARANPERIENLRRRARAHIMAHHTSAERARYLVETLMASGTKPHLG